MLELSNLKILNHLGGSTPVAVELDPSNLCNFNCKWCCFYNTRKKNLKSIPEGMLLGLIYEFAEIGVRAVTFTGGGEPLMNPATIGAMHLASGMGIDVGLVTNGRLLTEFGAIAECCSFVRISLDAATSETYSMVHRCRKEDFYATVVNIFNLAEEKKRRKSKTIIGISFLVSPENYREIYRAAALSKRLGADYFQIKPIFYHNEVKHQDVWPKAKAYIDKAVKLSSERFKVFPMDCRFSDIKWGKKTFKKCRIHNYLTNIGADGKVYLCCPFRGIKKYCLGDLKKSTFREIWSSPRRKKIIKSIDVTKCPYCRHNTSNSILEYVDSDRPHKNFI